MPRFTFRYHFKQQGKSLLKVSIAFHGNSFGNQVGVTRLPQQLSICRCKTLGLQPRGHPCEDNKNQLLPPPLPLVIFPYDPPNVRSIWLRLHFWSRATVARHSSGMYPIADALALSRGKGLHCSLRRSRNRGRRGFGGVDVRGVSPDTSAILIKRSGMAKVARNFTGA